MITTPLQRALARGMEPDGDLGNELSELRDYPIRTKDDALAICSALAKLPTPETKKYIVSSPLQRLAALFQDVEGTEVPAFDVMYEEGLPQLIRIFDARVEQAEESEIDDLLMVLKILAMYGLPEGADRVVAAARRPLKPDDYMWHVILSQYSGGSPPANYVFRSLSDPLPDDFLAVALLDAANGAAIAGKINDHPFNSPAGWKRLQMWLEDADPDHTSYAHSATAALPFVDEAVQDRLLTAAAGHADVGVRIESAWAAAKIGRESGLKSLARYCLDVNHADIARRYLAELDRENLVPATADEPEFRAKAEFAQWLAHPNELGSPPDEVAVVDHRELAWPPERERKHFWLIRFSQHDTTGFEADKIDVGLVGSMTWCFFSYHMHERPPEDAYAIHCYFELSIAKLIEEVEVTNPQEYISLLGQWRGSALDKPTIELIVEPAAELNYPGRMVAIASAKLNGRAGWVALDGPRTTWYAESDLPAETSGKQVMMIHVGRQLLGFTDSPDRKKYVVTDLPRREPKEIVTAYEKLLTEAADASPKRQRELLGGYGTLSRYCDKYLDAVATSSGKNRADVLLESYGRFLTLAKQADASVRSDVYESSGLLGEQFDAYIAALASRNRTGEIYDLIELFDPFWDHNLGYARLGNAALKGDMRESAERYFVKLYDDTENRHRFEEMSSLAEIWHRRGEVDRAQTLLVDCLQRLFSEIKKSKYISDRDRFGKEYLHHRNTYLHLFPDGESDLISRNLPADPQP